MSDVIKGVRFLLETVTVLDWLEGCLLTSLGQKNLFLLS